MKRFIFLLTVLSLCIFLGGIAFATNGDNLIGVGPTSRAMGGVGIAAPQDSISAIFNNPAALGKVTPTDSFTFGGTWFVPTVKAKVTMPAMYGGNWEGKSKDNPYAIPAIGLKTAIDKNTTFGFGAYGVSGLGVDYRNQDPMDFNTKVSVMKFTPAFAYNVENFSVGLGIDVDYQAADFGAGLSHGYALGARLGVLYDLGMVSFGATYVTPQKITHKRIYDFDGNGVYDDLKLENPQQVGMGIAFKPVPNLILETDAKWINWADTKGYGDKDFDWKNQWVYAVGLQYKPMPNLSLRAGYNYGKNPVKKHDAFDASGTRDIQGTSMSNFGYEYFRIIGFPAIVEQHITAGIGYDFSPKFGISLGYKHALNKKMSETDSSGAITLESSLKESAYDFGLIYRF